MIIIAKIATVAAIASGAFLPAANVTAQDDVPRSATFTIGAVSGSGGSLAE